MRATFDDRLDDWGQQRPRGCRYGQHNPIARDFHRLAPPKGGIGRGPGSQPIDLSADNAVKEFPRAARQLEWPEKEFAGLQNELDPSAFDFRRCCWSQSAGDGAVHDTQTRRSYG